MAPRTKTFKNCIIAYTDDIPLAKREKIKGWVEHAGGKISRQITDDVTHLILTRNDWKNYKQRPLGKSVLGSTLIYPRQSTSRPDLEFLGLGLGHLYQ